MRKAKKTFQNKQILNEDGVDVSPRPLAHWSTDAPTEEFEHIFLDLSPEPKHKSKKFLGSKHRAKSSASSSTFAEIENEKINQRWYFETDLWVPPEPVKSKETVILKEEGPFWLLDLTDFVIPKESEEYIAVEIRNQKYLKHAGTQVSPHKFFENDKHPGELHLSNTISGITFLEDNQTRKVTDEELLNNSNVLEASVYVERILQLSHNYIVYALYRNAPVIYEDLDEGHPQETQDETPSKKLGMLSASKSNQNVVIRSFWLRSLWSFRSDLTSNHAVTSICFNPTNSDILAAGYCKSDQQLQQQNGFVGCWTIKNIEYPERHFKTDSGVTTVAFSEINPFMLAVGFFNGGLAFYNVSTTTPSLLFSSQATALGHKNPVSALKWINKNGYEVLITTSTDGRVLQWSFLNGLQCKDIMRLKSIPSKSNVIKDQLSSGEYDGGLCFDFSCDQSEIYLIGTDSGYIHKCSAIHANQYFKTYSGHIGPVYKLKWAPGNPDMFASCSADMTVKIWHQDKSKSLHDLLPINPPNSPAFDLAWCPDKVGFLVCLFGTELQVWDLLSNKLDPIFIYRTEEQDAVAFTCLNYAARSIFFGNTCGSIQVHQMVENYVTKDHKVKEVFSQSLFQE